MVHPLCVFFLSDACLKKRAGFFGFVPPCVSLGRVRKKGFGQAISCENEDKEPILGIFFFSFGCNELKNLKLLIYS